MEKSRFTEELELELTHFSGQFPVWLAHSSACDSYWARCPQLGGALHNLQIPQF